MLANSIGMQFAKVSAGEFLMGSPESWGVAANDERPQHTVRVASPFYLGVTQVTQRQYAVVMGKNPSSFSKTGGGADHVKGMDTSDFPVEMISWHDTLEFCKTLSAKEHRKYRLPTEAEWEYACRAGTVTNWCHGDDQASLQHYAWYGGNANGTIHPVAKKKPNAWGLCDMHGNVAEWCSDWYGEDYYANSSTGNPTGPDAGSYRVNRGGSWYSPALLCRSAYRRGDRPSLRGNLLGFRVVVVPPH